MLSLNNNMFKKYKKIKNNGFSLIELIVALSITTVVFFSLINSFPFGLKITKSSETSTVASFLAQEKIEQFFAIGYNNLNSGMAESKQRLSSDPDNYLYHYFRDVSIEDVNEDLEFSASETGIKKINVNIYFQDSISKTEKLYTLSTLISQL